MPESDNTAAQATETSPAAEAVPQSQPDVQAAPQQQAAPSKDDFSWVPGKFIKEGKPDFKSLVTSYSSLEKKFSTGQRGAFAPDSVEEYEFDRSPDVQYDDELSNAFKSEAHKAGLSKDQYKWMMGKYEALVRESTPSADRAAAVLREEWGGEFNQQLASANRAWEVYGPSDINLAEHPEIANNPAVLKLLARIGGELGEDTAVPAAASSGGRTDVEKLMRDPDYWNNADKQRRVAAWFGKNSK